MWMDKSYSVYRHVFPTGETYIGITNGNVEDRWKNGFGYESQRKFFKRIVATGWDNIKHEIMYSNLTEEQARKIEKELIGQGCNTVLNTQHCKGVDLSWLKRVIADDSLPIRRRNFSQFNDRWLDKVRYRDTVPYTWNICDTYMELWYGVMVGRILERSYIRLPIRVGMSYRDLYDYICWKLDFCKEGVLMEQSIEEVAV